MPSSKANYTHFVWLRNNAGGYDAQLWTEDLSVGVPACGTKYRADCNREITERLAKKYTLPPEDAQIDLNTAKLKYPAPK